MVSNMAKRDAMPISHPTSIATCAADVEKYHPRKHSGSHISNLSLELSQWPLIEKKSKQGAQIDTNQN